MIFDNQVYEIDMEALLDNAFGLEETVEDALGGPEDLQRIEKQRELVDRVKSIIETLPPREADFVELYYFQSFILVFLKIVIQL